MVGVRDQYEALPYPERDPADERRRLVRGSPSNPMEVDHFLFGGRRDWSVPLKALFAGGGTGDGLIQMAQVMTSAGRPYDFTYLDLSTASRAIAEKRAELRGLAGITYLTGDLLRAPDLGRFDYIDCCGVLHHLPEPVAGFRALASALAPEGGLGFMVYAPYGRSGVYPLQEAFGALFEGLDPKARLAAARQVFGRLPAGHPFRRNPHLVDHDESDAGFYDLLLHSQDRAFDVGALLAVLDAAGLELSGFFEPARYDLSRFAPVPEGMDPGTAMAVAEKLDGTIKTHVGYAAAKGRGVRPAKAGGAMVPHLKSMPGRDLARAVAKGAPVTLTIGGEKQALELPREAAGLLAGIDGRRSLAELYAGAKLDPIRGGALWSRVERVLGGWGQLWYSGLLRG